MHTCVWVDRIALGYAVRVRVHLLVRVGTYFLKLLKYDTTRVHLTRGVVAEVLEGLALTPLVTHLVTGCRGLGKR